MESVTAAVGKDVSLGCLLEHKRDVTEELIQWKFSDSHVVVVYKSRDLSPGDQAEQFVNRTILDLKQLRRGNFTVKILSVNKTDDGNYTCSVGLYKDEISCTVHLTVSK